MVKSLAELQVVLEDMCDYSEEELELVKKVNADQKMKKRSSSLWRDVEFLKSERDYMIEKLYSQKKQLKYSSIVIQLYAALEQALVELYEQLTNQKFVLLPQDGTKKNPPKITYLLHKLQELGIYFDSDAELLRLIRNETNHENLNFKKAKENLAEKFDYAQYYLKSKDLVQWLIDDVRDGFVSSVRIMEPMK